VRRIGVCVGQGCLGLAYKQDKPGLKKKKKKNAKKIPKKEKKKNAVVPTPPPLSPLPPENGGAKRPVKRGYAWTKQQKKFADSAPLNFK